MVWICWSHVRVEQNRTEQNRTEQNRTERFTRIASQTLDTPPGKDWWATRYKLLRGKVNWFFPLFVLKPCLVIYGGQFPQLEEQIVAGSEPVTFRSRMTTLSHGIQTRTLSGEGRVVSKRDALTTRPRRPHTRILNCGLRYRSWPWWQLYRWYRMCWW